MLDEYDGPSPFERFCPNHAELSPEDLQQKHYEYSKGPMVRSQERFDARLERYDRRQKEREQMWRTVPRDQWPVLKTSPVPTSPSSRLDAPQRTADPGSVGLPAGFAEADYRSQLVGVLVDELEGLRKSLGPAKRVMIEVMYVLDELPSQYKGKPDDYEEDSSYLNTGYYAIKKPFEWVTLMCDELRCGAQAMSLEHLERAYAYPQAMRECASVLRQAARFFAGLALEDELIGELLGCDEPLPSLPPDEDPMRHWLREAAQANFDFEWLLKEAFDEIKEAHGESAKLVAMRLIGGYGMQAAVNRFHALGGHPESVHDLPRKPDFSALPSKEDLLAAKQGLIEASHESCQTYIEQIEDLLQMHDQRGQSAA